MTTGDVQLELVRLNTAIFELGRVNWREMSLEEAVELAMVYLYSFPAWETE